MSFSSYEARAFRLEGGGLAQRTKLLLQQQPRVNTPRMKFVLDARKRIESKWE